MRILVISDLPQFVTGGAERQASHLIESWLNAGHDVTCYGRRMRARFVYVGRYKVPIRRIHTVQKWGRLMRAVSYFCSLCMLLLRHRQQFDVIYTRFLGEAAVTVSLLKQFHFLNVVLIATPANTGGEGDANFLSTIPFRNQIVRLLDMQCDAINLIAPAMAEELHGIGFSGRNFTHIRNGVIVRSKPPNHESRCNHFIAVGRLSHQKGYDILLEALSRIRDLCVPGMVRIVGDGPERVALQLIADRLGVVNIISWLGELEYSAVMDELDHSRVFLLPSRYEGMSNAGLEAMERGLPLIISRCGGLDTYIQSDAGWTVDPGDATSLAQALKAALSAAPQTLANMGIQNRTLVQHEFDINVTATRYLSMFLQLLETRQSESPQ